VAKSNVLKALRIFSLEEMLSLSQAANIKPVLMKKAAGEDLLAWTDAPSVAVERHAKGSEERQGVVLPFKSKVTDSSKISESAPVVGDTEQGQGELPSSLFSTESMLWSKELSRDSSAPTLKKDAAKEYARSAEMYVVKTTTIEGKDKIRFASTNGVLVDKKQA
jgi:hypothetical protein